MKKQIKHLKLYLPLLIVLVAFSGISQGSITHVALRENRSGNGDCTQLDIPQILGNPAALLFITQKEQGSNPHPIGAFYFKNRWNIMNLDQATMPDYSKFNVEYFINPDNDHFQYVIKKEDIRKDGTAIINHPALNDHPDSKFSIFHTWAPESKEYGNREETSVQYYPSINRWVLKNVNNKSLVANVAYNIAVSSHGKTVSNPITTNPVTTPVNTTPVTTTPVTISPINNNSVNTNPTNTNTNSSANPYEGPIAMIFMSSWINGIKLPGENLINAHFDQCQVLGFDMGVTTAREVASGRATGRRQHEPLTIKCVMGYSAAIMLFDALVNNKAVTVNLDFYSNSAAGNGTMGLNYTIKLTTAILTSFKQSHEESALFNPIGNGKRSYYELKFTFAKIEFVSPSAMAEDTN